MRMKSSLQEVLCCNPLAASCRPVAEVGHQEQERQISGGDSINQRAKKHDMKMRDDEDGGTLSLWFKLKGVRKYWTSKREKKTRTEGGKTTGFLREVRVKKNIKRKSNDGELCAKEGQGIRQAARQFMEGMREDSATHE